MFSLRHVPAGMIGAFSLMLAGLAQAQVAEATDDEGVKIRFQGGVNAVAERNLFWRFADVLTGAFVVTEVDAPTWSGGFVNLIVNY